MTNVWVASFEPPEDSGGIGGFHWFLNEELARSKFAALEADEDVAGTRLALWSIDVEHVDVTSTDPTVRDTVTDLIDEVFWDGNFKPVQVTVTG